MCGSKMRIDRPPRVVAAGAGAAAQRRRRACSRPAARALVGAAPASIAAELGVGPRGRGRPRADSGDAHEHALEHAPAARRRRRGGAAYGPERGGDQPGVVGAQRVVQQRHRASAPSRQQRQRAQHGPPLGGVAVLVEGAVHGRRAGRRGAGGRPAAGRPGRRRPRSSCGSAGGGRSSGRGRSAADRGQRSPPAAGSAGRARQRLGEPGVARPGSRAGAPAVGAARGHRVSLVPAAAARRRAGTRASARPRRARRASAGAARPRPGRGSRRRPAPAAPAGSRSRPSPNSQVLVHAAAHVVDLHVDQVRGRPRRTHVGHGLRLEAAAVSDVEGQPERGRRAELGVQPRASRRCLAPACPAPARSRAARPAGAGRGDHLGAAVDQPLPGGCGVDRRRAHPGPERHRLGAEVGADRRRPGAGSPAARSRRRRAAASGACLRRGSSR